MARRDRPDDIARGLFPHQSEGVAFLCALVAEDGFARGVRLA